jgi:hypothetical protein
VDILLLGRQFEVDKLHILPATQTKVMHERLEKFFAMAIARVQLATDLGVEDLGLFDAAGDVEESDE